MKRFFALAICLLGGFALTPAALAQKDCTAIGSAAKPRSEERFVELASAPHFRFSAAISGKTCMKGKSEIHRGIVDVGGLMLVPAKYASVVVLTPSLAAVTDLKGQVRLYNIGKGEGGKAPFSQTGYFGWHQDAWRIGFGYNEKASGLRDYFIYSNAAGTPVRISDVSEVQRAGKLFVADFTAADGAEVSRLIDDSGALVSPIVPRIEIWTSVPPTSHFTYSSDDTYRKKINDQPAELVSKIGKLDEAAASAEHVYLPLSDDGTPLPLAPGAIGVIPLMPEPGHVRHAFGWATVFASPGGLEFAIAYGDLQASLAQGASAPRVRALRWHVMPTGTAFRDARHYLTVQDERGWRPVLANKLSQPGDMPFGGSFETSEAAVAAYASALQAKDQRVAAATQAYYQEREQEALRWAAVREQAEASKRAGNEAVWRTAKSDGTLCENEAGLLDWPTAGVEDFLLNCPVTLRVTLDKRTDASASALRAGWDKYAVHERQMFDEAHQRMNGSANLGSGGDPWAAGLAAAQAAS
ncbi:MAG: hypothetical protein ACK4P2_11165, partial [Hyphomonas sp.]